MAVRRSQNWLNQQRVDVPHLRSVESAIRNDFDELFVSLILGESESYVIRGLEIEMAGAIGSSANGLQLIVENSSVLHGKSDESGTFFQIPSGTSNQVLSATTNVKVEGAFTPSALNYVSIEFVRAVDDSTTSQVYLWNPTTGSEITKTLPLAETLDYKIVVSSTVFASNVLPIAIVETDSSNNVLSIQDRRPMLFRLGTAGSATPDPFHEYEWNNHAEGRSENFWQSSSSSTSPFRGGDKQILTFKENDEAIKTEIKLMKGTNYWYSENIGGSIYHLRADIANTIMTSQGTMSHDDSNAGQINWSHDLYLDFIGSRISYKIESNAATTDVDLDDGEVAYIKLVRGELVVPNLIFTNGSPVVTSVGAVSWTNDLEAGDYIKQASHDDTKYYQIQSVDTASQVTLTEAYGESSTGSTGTEAKYAFGVYRTAAIPSTDRHMKIADKKDVPFGQDFYWLFFRNDNGGATAKIFVRGGGAGGELEQGETRQVSDNQTLDVLEYIGSPVEGDTTPDYTNSIVTALAEITTYNFPPASDITSGQSLKLNSANDVRQYYAWFNKDGAGGDPLHPGLIGIEVPISTGDTNVQVGAAYHAAVDAIGDFNSVDNLNGTVTVTNSQVGSTTDATNVDVGGAFSISIDQDGAGRANREIVDDENLTKSIKRLDEALAEIQDALDDPAYEEKLDVVSGAPADDNEVSGPISSGTNITIPLNSRASDIQHAYTVGAATLGVYLNGQRLIVGVDYTEIGTSGDPSATIQTQIDLVVGDTLLFKYEPSEGAGGAGGGGSASGVNLGTVKDADVFKQTVGDQLQFRRLQAGSNVTITQDGETVVISSTSGVANSTTKDVTGVNYTLTGNDDFIKVTNSGTDVTLQLPSSIDGKIYYIKKLDVGNTLYIKSTSGQTLDGVDIDATPHAINTQYESITIIGDGNNWWII